MLHGRAGTPQCAQVGGETIRQWVSVTAEVYAALVATRGGFTQTHTHIIGARRTEADFGRPAAVIALHADRTAPTMAAAITVRV